MKEDETKKLKRFSELLNVSFKDFQLLKEALTHRSTLNESKNKKIHSNERLEFLGDAVLELIVTEYLFQKYPDREEGDLTSFRAALVRTESLAETSLNLKYSDFLYMSKGEELTGGRLRPYILANAFEAVLGAIYLDQGYEVSKKFVLDNLVTKIDSIVSKRLDIDAKSKLQEIAQEKLKFTPTYEIVSATGPDHDKLFKVQVLIGEKVYAHGSGKNKQEAEQEAARNALLKHFD